MGDITKINGAEIEPVDVITFGSPCQDLSIAGLRKGLAGSRSGLYVQAVRVIREMLDATNREYPKFVVFENVPGMLSSNKGNDFVAALDMMSELRFIPDPNIHDAQYCGVPQRRRRIGIAWANTDAILKKRTILSDSIMLQCLSEILLIDLTEALQVFGIEPKGQQYRAKWLSEDGRRRRIELFSLQKENALQMWQQRLDEMQATYQNAQDCSASTVGEVQMDFFTLIDVGTSTDAKTESGSISIGKLLSRQSGEDSNQPNGYTTSTWTKEIIPSKIYTCFQALLDILALTGAYISSAARTNSDVKSYFEWVLYILMLTKEYINARQANGTSVAKLVGDDVLRDWNIRLQACEDKVVADFGGDTASEIQFDSESVSGDIAESGAAGEGFAEAAERGFNPAVARSLTARADGSPCADRGPNIVCSPHQGGCDGGGKGALVQTEKSGTLGTGNDQTIFTPTPINLMVATRCKALGRGTGFGVGEPGDPANTISAAHSHGVFATAIPINDKATRWQGGGESRNHDGSGNGLGIGKEGDPSPTLTDGDRHGVMCAGFKLGNSEQARSIGYQEELSPTLNAECGGNKPAVVAPAVALDMTHACDVIRECGEQVPALQARMGTGGNQVPLTYGIGNGQACEASIMAEEVSQTLNTMHDAQAILYQPKSAMEENWAESETKNALRAGESKVSHAVVCEDVSHTIRAKANCAYREDAETYVAQNMVVRRLTPMECERLQGFPDGWTDIGDWVKTDKRGREIKVKGSADSPRYKALGNSIALPFWDWMLRRMARYLPEGATLGSLFDGIGGFPLVFERIHGKGTARWASEIEPFPIAVTKKHFPEEE